MGTKSDLCRAEDAGWAELIGMTESLTPEQLEEPGYFEEGWSVRDLMAHIASWQAEAGQVLEQIRWGTLEDTPIDVDAMNQRFYEANRDLPISVVRAELWSSRNRMLAAMNALPEVTPKAEEWFVESGSAHYQEHLPALRAWAQQLLSGARPG
jgi:hypothetical protein